ncbi:MAG: Crp/Fnr family transcriptional regulator [Treponema sp.]|nr:Crp/Fnr family transcriptional regulator [Treponema sp.]
MPTVKQYTKGSIPYFAGDQDERIFILQQGLVILTSVDPETGKTNTEQVRPGEFFGVKSALGHFPREETATVLAESVTVVLSIAEFEQLFSNNKQIIMKMLRVFSNQLRQIHRKTESILNNVPEDPQSGMLSVAKSFYEDDEFSSCCDICIKFLKRFPTSALKNEIANLYKDANIREKKKQSRAEFDEVPPESDSSMKQFDLPAFERFAKNYAPGKVIISEFEPGDTFYLIQSGIVQLVKSVNGHKKNLDILKAGEFFGEMAILDNSPRSATCMAKTQVKCLEFSKENFEALITGNPMLALKLLKLFCKRIYDQKRRFKILVIKDLQAKLADVFLMLDEMNPSKNKDTRIRRFNVTVADIAHWAGLSQEETRDEINKFVEKRKIDVYDTYMVVNNISDMKRILDTRTQADNHR